MEAWESIILILKIAQRLPVQPVEMPAEIYKQCIWNVILSLTCSLVYIPSCATYIVFQYILGLNSPICYIRGCTTWFLIICSTDNLHYLKSSMLNYNLFQVTKKRGCFLCLNISQKKKKNESAVFFSSCFSVIL